MQDPTREAQLQAPEGWKRTGNGLGVTQGGRRSGGLPWPFVSGGRGGISSTGAPVSPVKGPIMERLKIQGTAHPTSLLSPWRWERMGGWGGGAMERAEKGGRWQKGWQWKMAGGRGDRAGGESPSPPSIRAAGGIAQLHFALIASSPPSAGGVTHTPWGLPGPSRACPLPCSGPSDL